MEINNKNEFIIKGYNEDIVAIVIDTYKQYKNQPVALVDELHRHNIDVQCESIFDYLVNNVQYKEDDAGVQLIKTPGRLLADGVGDCKSMSIFIGACLNCLNVPFVFRFVGFNKNKIYNHVYIVAMPGTDDEIILDPVERIDDMPVYNYAREFVIKKDIKG